MKSSSLLINWFIEMEVTIELFGENSAINLPQLDNVPNSPFPRNRS